MKIKSLHGLIKNFCGQLVFFYTKMMAIKNHKIITLKTMPIESMAIKKEPVVNKRKMNSRNSNPKMEFSLP